MSFIEELKRRNVFRVGIAYAVAAWVLLQMVDVIGDIIELPDWLGKAVLLAVVAGIIPVVFFAWAFELTPEGIKREKDVDRNQSITSQTGSKLNTVTLSLMAIAIGYLLLDKFYLADRIEGPAATAVELVAEPPEAISPSAPPEKTISRQSIAVLPFENRSKLEDDAFFVEGMHDDLLTNLARIGSLKVISRTSVGQYAGTTKSIPEIAQELGVATIMEGAVQRSGNTVRINVQLIDAQTDEHLWAEIFDRELTADNLFAIQSEISEEIAEALQATLTPEDKQRLNDRPTENLAAYEAYLRGRQLMARRISTDMDQAAVEFQKAVELDPDFALGWVAVAETSSLRTQYSSLDPVESLKIEQEVIEKALTIDDQLGEAYLSRTSILRFYDRNKEAEADFRKAIELSPSYATAYHWYAGFVLNYPSRLEEGLQLLNKAIELDPLAPVIKMQKAYALMQLGQYAETEALLRGVLQANPEFVSTYSAIAQLKRQTGQFDEAVEWQQKAILKDPGRMGLNMDLIWDYMNLGYPEGLQAVKLRMAEINDQNPMMAMADMMTNVYNGKYDAAMESARWMYEALGRPPSFNNVFAYIYNTQGKYAEAREALELGQPRFFDRSQWRSALDNTPEDGCLAGWLMLKTGDEELGMDLINLATQYIVSELPGYIEHAHRYDVASCYAALGEFDKAILVVFWVPGRARDDELKVARDDELKRSGTPPSCWT
jgi:TolB-like protein